LPAAVADAHLLLNGDGDISTVHHLLADAIRTKRGTADGGGFSLAEALRTWLMVCLSAGRPELWAPLRMAVADPIAGAPAELPLVVSICTDPARSASCVLGQLDAALSDLARKPITGAS
jgi:hypothetical protein